MGFDTIKEKKAESANFMANEITKVIKTFGKRNPGSEGEKKACEYMASQLQEYGCDDVKVEPFELHPNAFYGWIYISVTLVLVALGLYFVGLYLNNAIWTKLVSLGLIAIGCGIMVGEFMMYLKLVDKLYPKETSHNVTATKKPTGEVKRRVFFNGHPDAAGEWTFNYLLGGTGFAAHFLISIAGIFYFLGIIFASFFTAVQNAQGINFPLIIELGLGTLAFVPFWLALIFLWNEKKIVDGANDNLTGCYMGIAIMKALKDNNIELENTEVGVIISGSEEAGLRGAKAWCKAHGDEYKDVDTIIYAYDTIREGKFLCVNEKDLNATVSADPHAVALFKNAADKLNITCNYGTVPFGSTDAAAFTQGGYKSVGITAMDHNLKNYYHTRRDSYDNLDNECLADCFAVSVQMLEDFDAGK
ncbi:MAG TPA: M20/M25/M40 family metallo-hydrolase [Clostridia bacterium]|nr:M20/M25/M40 family metallo-hydrolase [Clostridia bacterium]